MLTSTANTPKIHTKRKGLLDRYLPPIPDRFVHSWIEAQELKGKNVIDPFGVAPSLSLQVAHEGTRLIVAANNPISRLLVEVAANPPTLVEQKTVLAALSTARVRDERLETHISTLYQTNCPNCGATIGVEAFIWERESKIPFARLIDCPHCDTKGDFPTTEADIDNAMKFPVGGLHHSRALERVAPLHDPDRMYVEDALNVYPPRAIYALLTIINKLDVLNLSPTEDKYLAALLLSAFDQANTLWPHPIARERPRQLTIPPVYRENNIWLALENAAKEWEHTDLSVPVTYWPALPTEPIGICLFKGRIKDLAEQLSEVKLDAVLTALPRPNQAFWTLSALWSGWLWGHEAVDHFKSVLRRRRYDWAWHTTAIHAALNSLRPALQDDVPVYCIVSESEPGFVGAVSIATALANFQLEDMALWSDEKLAQLRLRVKQQTNKPDEHKQNFFGLIKKTACEYLIQRGEPANYLQVYTAILETLGRENVFQWDKSPAEIYSQTQGEIQSVLDSRDVFLRFDGSEKSLDVGQWWLVNDAESNTPLADQTEIAVVQNLIQNPGRSLDEIIVNTQSQFPTLLIPDAKLVIECVESYGEYTRTGWYLREQDTPSRRRSERALMLDTISQLGQKLGFQVKTQDSENPQSIWRDKQGFEKYLFYISASALLGKFLAKENPAPAQGIIVLPGGRANLVMFKLGRDPRLQNKYQQGWYFLKYRHARQLANNPTLTMDNLESQLILDPLTYNKTQLRMF